ncbi:protein kinase-like domain-containing protein [Artemisia annua]|uniref:non-specific serine/threonine protein kinase n=1 Tax=Artemisia annua TaxID=35608 RepID=A0A2U1NQG1_ARTAN|nr:protein kinase-like domain-containing protein [Artemisia annua]
MSHPFLLFLPLFFFIITIAAAQTNISAFQNCLPTVCNGFNISYPFWKYESQNSQYCGYEGLGIICPPIREERPMMHFGDNSYHVLNLTNTSITLVDVDVFGAQTRCQRVGHRIELGQLPLNFTSRNLNLSFHFNCTTVPNFASEIPCPNNQGTKSCVHVVRPDTLDFDWKNMCAEEVIKTVINVSDSFERLGTEFVDALRRGFELNWTTTTDDDCEKCEESGGLCGHNPSSTESFMCFCADGSLTRNDCNGEARRGCKPDSRTGHIFEWGTKFWKFFKL